ncbi:aldose epimerase family protein [Azospirillum sp. ST 5-10]|uniref:aldose epimerase family protein n=1 Tax=unclassified Azospirillum TaxID=2630922 RepID=UPI003F49DFC6
MSVAVLPDGRLRIEAGGLSAVLLPFGARLAELHAPDAAGRTADVVLGFDDAAGYARSDAYMGAICGRYGNRIAGGAFTLDGIRHALARNDPPNHLHGGVRGFDRAVWTAEPEPDGQADAVRFRHRSADGDEGYPGAVEVEATYALGGDGTVRITMRGTTDRPTVLNLVHHSYWNLGGHGSGDVLGHVVRVDADRYTPVDATLIPTGAPAPVAGTPFDLRIPVALGDAMAGVPGGFDHNWVLNGGPDPARPRVRVVDPVSGRGLEIATTAPGLQLYAGGKLGDAVPGKGGARYRPFAGLALETQAFPDSPNRPDFPSVRLDPGEIYEHLMVLRLFAVAPA